MKDKLTKQPVERLLTTEELAFALSLHPQTIRSLTRTGKIPVIRIGDRSLRYRLSDVLAVFSSNALDSTHKP